MESIKAITAKVFGAMAVLLTVGACVCFVVLVASIGTVALPGPAAILLLVAPIALLIGAAVCDTIYVELMF